MIGFWKWLIGIHKIARPKNGDLKNIPLDINNVLTEYAYNILINIEKTWSQMALHSIITRAVKILIIGLLVS